MSKTPEPQRPANALVSQLQSDEFHWFDAIGGWRGIVESTVPVLVFLFTLTFTRDLWLTAAVSAGVSVVFILARLVMRDSVSSALSGAFGVLIGLAIALWTGREENFFAVGLINAAIFTLAMILTIAFKKPAAGLAISAVWPLPQGWMAKSSYSALYRRCVKVTWLWASMFIFRFLAQLPLWLNGDAQALGTAKLILGLPLFALVGALTWHQLRPFADLAKNSPQDEGQA